MSQDCDMDDEDTHPSLQPIDYVDSMALDTDATSKPRTLFSLLLDKRNSLSSSRHRKRRKSQSTNHLHPSSSHHHHHTSSPPSFEDRRHELSTEELRVVKDLTEISDSKWCARGTVVTIHLFGRLHNLRCTISPEEGYYRHGTFSFDIAIPKNYPFSPPLLRASHPMFHPNINPQSLAVGLSILTLDWKPVLSLNDVLFALQLLFMQPNIDPIDHPQNSLNHRNDANPQIDGMEEDSMEITESADPQNPRNSKHSVTSMSSSNHNLNHNHHHHHHNRNRNQFAFGVNNLKPHYVQNIAVTASSSSVTNSYSNSNHNHNALQSDRDEYGIIQNMEAALMFRDEPRKFEKMSQQIIRGGVTLFGTNWQCVERKKMRNSMQNGKSGEKYDPSLGPQTFRLSDSDATITKKCSVLRKRRRNEEGDDILNMKQVQRALRGFASTTGSTRDRISPASSECSETLIDGMHSIELGPPQKKRRVELSGSSSISPHATASASLEVVHEMGGSDAMKRNRNNKRSVRSFGIRIVHEDNDDIIDTMQWGGSPPKRQRTESPAGSSDFHFSGNELKRNVEKERDRMDNDFEMI